MEIGDSELEEVEKDLKDLKVLRNKTKKVPEKLDEIDGQESGGLMKVKKEAQMLLKLEMIKLSFQQYIVCRGKFCC